MKNVKIYGVQEMSTVEMKKTDGGSIFGAIALCITIIGAVAYVVDHWDSVVEGWNAGAEAARNN